MATTIYKNVRKYAAQKKISLTNLEIKAGLGNGTIGKWENSIPRIDKLAAVATELGVSVDDLLKEE